MTPLRCAFVVWIGWLRHFDAAAAWTSRTAWSPGFRSSRDVATGCAAAPADAKSDAVAAVTGVTLKVALDANGAAADRAAHESLRFTCGEALDMVHRLRCCSDAVLVGRGTVQADNPSLTVRRTPCDRQPLRVVLDPRLELLRQKTDQGARFALLEDGLTTVVYHTVPDLDEDSLNLLETITVVYVPPTKPSGDNVPHGDYLSAATLTQDLRDRFGVNHLMVEGGPLTARQFLYEHQVDRVILVHASLCFRQPLESGLTEKVLVDAGLEKLGTEPCGVDQIEYWSRPELPWPTTELSKWP